MRVFICMFGLAVALMPSALAHENHDHATGVVKERMVAMEAMAKHMKAISERIKEKRDLSAVKGEAEAVAKLASHITHLFPPGSTQHPTAARSTVWQSWPDFERLAKATEAASTRLAAAKADDGSGLAKEARAVSQTCLACHEKYRVRK
jgi:cytochrome c556